MTGEALYLMLALIGTVIMVTALLSGFIDRSNFPQVALFLGLGAALGPYGAGLLDIGLDSPILRIVATLSLALVLFTDALTLNLSEVRKHASLAGIILGPGTFIAAFVIAAAAMWLLGLPPALAAILAAPLASTDPVILRALLRRRDLPRAARLSLRLESGLNDVVLLPIVLVAMALVAGGAGESPNLGGVIFRMLVIGPGAGAIVALIGIWGLEFMRRRVGVRRDYESIYSLGIAMAAFAAAESVHSSGFLAAFAAGLTIAALDVELCDCFREYGETTAEMLLMLTFVLLGASLIWTGLQDLTPAVLIFAFVALFARSAALAIALIPTRADARAKAIIAWFGPRGLSTLLLILVAVFERTPGTERLFQICSLVVLLSVVIHGGTIMSFSFRSDRRAARTPLPQAPTEEHHEAPLEVSPVVISVSQLKRLMERGENVWLLDVRSDASFLDSEAELERAVRIEPGFARRSAVEVGLPKDAWAALFCT